MLLRVLVFVCGAALMALEILGARVLAPALGNSIFVWGALISTFMTAMALGYWFGGVLSERAAHMRAIGLAASGAGAMTVLVPALAAAVLPRAATLGPRLGPLVASGAIFFAPTLMIATISPIAVRVAARSTTGVGRTAGGLYSLSTAGSILGSLGTAFWLIPIAPVDTLVASTGLLLVAAGLAAAFAPVTAEETAGRRPAWTVAVATVSVIAMMLGIASLSGMSATDAAALARGERIVYRKDTQYHRITVIDKGDVRSLKFDDRRQSAIDLSDPYQSDIRYTDYLHLALALKPDAKRVLVLGLGGGVLPKRMWHDYPGISVDSVEIDPVVVDVAHRYFGMPNDPRLRVFTGDGRQFVAATKERYDIVVVDAYYADSLPFHMATAEFFGQVRDILTPGGVVAYNIIASVDGDGSRLFRSIYKTADGVWPHLYAFPIALSQDRAPTAVRNIVLLATAAPVSREELLSRIASRVDGRVTIPGFQSFGDDLDTKPVPTRDVPTLTDGYAPVDSLIHLAD
jgi:spermidine synthase